MSAASTQISLYCTAVCSEWSSYSQTPSRHCQRVITVKPGVSPTEPGGTDLSSTSFHLCLNVTPVKAHTHREAHTLFIRQGFPPCHIHFLSPHSYFVTQIPNPSIRIIFVFFQEHLVHKDPHIFQR